MSTKKELIVKQVRFWVLMAGGATLTGASEAVGVSRATAAGAPLPGALTPGPVPLPPIGDTSRA